MSEGKYSELSNVEVRKLIAERLGYRLVEQHDKYISHYVVDANGRIIASALPVSGAAQAWAVALSTANGIPNWPTSIDDAEKLIPEGHQHAYLRSKDQSICLIAPQGDDINRAVEDWRGWAGYAPAGFTARAVCEAWLAWSDEQEGSRSAR